MYRKDIIPLKTLIMEGSSRLKECLAHTSDDALEEKAILNEFYRCCIHSWSNKEDSILWERHSIAMTIRSYREEDGLNKEGWQYVQSKGMKMLGQYRSQSFLLEFNVQFTSITLLLTLELRRGTKRGNNHQVLIEFMEQDGQPLMLHLDLREAATIKIPLFGHITSFFPWYIGIRNLQRINYLTALPNLPLQLHLLKMYSSIMDKMRAIPTQQLIEEGSSRLYESLAYNTDEILEAKARSNEIFRCVMHTWGEDEDCILWHENHDVMKIRQYRSGFELRDVGWKLLQDRFYDMGGHLVPLNFLKGHIMEHGRDKVGIVEPGMGRSMLDIDHCILYHSWCHKHDQWLLEYYKMLLQRSEHGKEKEFLDRQDWKELQHEFEFNFKCCPTQTQLQARVRYVLRNI
ncbi:hypothetical protein IEQ34_008841 [Dendrobium chrysotoxum]|uniref:Uncharacterized protein n=1 Tax=Dendrobium chrysotoxum TaxID=161865 RepID=A0AAV7GWY7_DENCH|nr:hypothetical protein IEQ34_008841 [Dendrobium chrysotoxum]